MNETSSSVAAPSDGRSADWKTVALGICAIVTAVAVWIASRGYPTTANISMGLGAAFFPRLIAVGMGLLGVAIAIQGFGRRDRKDEGRVGYTRLWRPSLFMAVILAYFWGLLEIGFVGATVPFLVAEMAIMRAPMFKAVLVAIIVTLGAYVVFDVILQVPLPTSNLLPF